MRRWTLFLLLGTLSLGGCFGGGGKGPPPGVDPLEILTTSLPDAVVDANYFQGIQVTGGTPPFAWRLSAGELPDGLTLSSVTGILIGTPTTAGSSTFTVEVKDSSNQTATQEFTLLVAERLVITTESLPEATLAVDYSERLETSGGTGEVTWAVVFGNLPAGLTLDPSGLLSGTPISLGPEAFSVQATDSGSPPQVAARAFTLSVLPRAPGVVTRASVDTSGAEANGASTAPAISAPGLQVAFASLATNLVTADMNGVSDIFLFDFVAVTTTRLSLTATGVGGNGASRSVALNGDATAAVFESDATDLSSADENDVTDIYIRLIGAQTTGRVSVLSDESEANGPSLSPALSDDGVFVAFASDATNLVAGDTNNLRDIFLRNRSTGTTSRLSVGPGGTQATAASDAPSMSGTTGAVAFASSATELIVPASSGTAHIFVHEADPSGGGAGVNTLVSMALNLPDTTADIFGPDSIGSSTLTMTPNEQVGRRVQIIFQTKLELDNQTADIFSAITIGNSMLTMVTNEQVGRLVEIVAGTGAGQVRRIVSNTATTLTVDAPWDTVPDATSVFRVVSELPNQERLISSNTVDTIFVTPPWDTTPDDTSVFRVVSEGDAGSAAPAVSGNGRFVAFESLATNLLGLDALDTGYDTNGLRDIFVHDRETSVTFRVSVVLELANQTADIFSATTIGNSMLTLTMDEHAGRLVEIVEGTGAGQVRRVVTNDPTTLTVDLAWIIPPDDTSVFRVVSEANGASFTPSISGDGRFVAFASDATDLDPSDTNGFADIFVHDRQTGITIRVSILPPFDPAPGEEADGDSRLPALSRDGRFVAFESDASNLLPPGQDTNGVADIFLAFTGFGLIEP
ncbi:MAG: putative Ig domain-containing protein [Terriglobia bacterium]